MNGPFSPFVIKALVDTVTGGVGQGPDMAPPIGIYRSGPKIVQFFLDCGLDMRLGISSRVPATTDFLRATAEQEGGVEYIKRVILKVCDPREYLSEPEKAGAVRDHLNRALEPDGLSPSRTDLPQEVEQDVRQILNGLTSVAKGVGALRTHGGDAHGREKGFRRLDARIARLALNAAGSITLFLIETWERKEHRALPQHGAVE